MISNHAQGFILKVGNCGIFSSCLDQGLEQVNLIIAMHIL